MKRSARFYVCKKIFTRTMVIPRTWIRKEVGILLKNTNWRHGQCEEIHFGSATLNQTMTKVQTFTRNCDKRHRRRSLERTHLALFCTV